MIHYFIFIVQVEQNMHSLLSLSSRAARISVRGENSWGRPRKGVQGQSPLDAGQFEAEFSKISETISIEIC